ncbi:hypothetical protein ACOSQ2_014103 [Xanthoceras sorbifolium]
MMLLGKDLRTNVEYWAMKLVDNLDEFNQFPWGSFVYSRTFKSLSICCKDREQIFIERAKNDLAHTVEKYNSYGFVYAFQVWAFEAILLYSKMSYARRVSRTTPHILNWEAKITLGFETLKNEISKSERFPRFKL